MIPGLDGLRAIAFLLIFFFHTDYLPFGWVGVQLFFVLSGYLITSILIRMRQDYSTYDYYIKFYGRRFLRIFPLYYFYLFIMFILTSWLLSRGFRPGIMKLFREQLPYAISYLYNFFYASKGYKDLYFLIHFWSLSVEEQFYIFWPLIIFLTPPRAQKKLFVFIIIFTPLLRFMFVYKHSLFPLLNNAMPISLYPLTFNHLDAFGFGALITVWRIPKPKLQFILLSIFLPIVAYLWQYFLTNTTEPLYTMGYGFLMPIGYQYLWGYSVLNYYFTILLYLVVKERLFQRLLEGSILKYFGKISYGLYIYHNGIIWFSLRMIDLGIPTGLLRPVSTLVAFVVTLILASISYQFIERPFLQLKDRYFARE